MPRFVVAGLHRNTSVLALGFVRPPHRDDRQRSLRPRRRAGCRPAVRCGFPPAVGGRRARLRWIWRCWWPSPAWRARRWGALACGRCTGRPTQCGHCWWRTAWDRAPTPGQPGCWRSPWCASPRCRRGRGMAPAARFRRTADGAIVSALTLQRAGPGLLPTVETASLAAHLEVFGTMPAVESLAPLMDAAGLPGRGGAAFPVARKLRSVAGGARAGGSRERRGEASH